MNKKNLSPKKIFNLAFEHHQKNNFQIAENLYREILKAKPDHIETIFLLGSLSAQRKNFNMAKKLLRILKYNTKIKYVKDRPGHDFRYALDSRKIRRKLKWKPKINLSNGLKNTFEWYLNNINFFSSVSKKLYDKRLGLNKK